MQNKPKIIRTGRRTIMLQVLPDATLVVKAPYYTPGFFINRFLENNKEWIEKKINYINNRKIKSKVNFNEGEAILYLGNEYFIKLYHGTKIELKDNQILIPASVKFRIKKELSLWFLNHARLLITKQVDYYSGLMNASYTDLRFSDTKSQWGRCTADNKLQFSWRLIMAPLLVINYVVVHELVHTFEKNHSRSFWNKVRFYNPSYRQQIKWLRDNGHSLKD